MKYLITLMLAASAFAQTLLVTHIQSLNSASGGPFGCSGQTGGYQDNPFCTIYNGLPLGTWAPSNRPNNLTFTDWTFGGQVHTLTPYGNPSPTDFAFHMYSYPSPWSRNKKYLLAQDLIDNFENIYDGATGALIRAQVPYWYQNSESWTAWDPTNEDIFYYVLNAILYSYSVSANTSTQVYDFTPQGFTAGTMQNGSNSEISPNGWAGFYDLGVDKTCAVNVHTSQAYCSSFGTGSSSANYNSLGVPGACDWITSTPGVDSVTGKQYLIQTCQNSSIIWAINTTAGTLDFVMRGPAYDSTFAYGGSGYTNDGSCQAGNFCMKDVGGADHAATFQDASGKQYMFDAEDFCMNGVSDGNGGCRTGVWTRGVYLLALSAGTKMTTQVANGGGAQLVFVMMQGSTTSDVHNACAQFSAIPTCVVSTDYTYPGNGQPSSSVPFATTPHYEQIWLLSGPSTLTNLTKISSTYSVELSNDTYYSQSRAAIAPDGSAIIFDSNFGIGRQWYMNIVNVAPYNKPAMSAASRGWRSR